MVLFAIIKRVILIISLIAVVSYAVPYTEKFFGETTMIGSAKNAITSYAAREIVAPIAQTIAEKAASIAEEASGQPISTNAAVKTKFFPKYEPKNKNVVSISSQISPNPAQGSAGNGIYATDSASSPEKDCVCP